MEAFRTYTGLVLPFDRSNVDTDTIIPKQYLKSVERTGFGVNLFDSLRYLDAGEVGQDHSKRRLDMDFILNQPHYAGAGILLTRENFACGSSREHAVWSLLDYGFRVIIAVGFADIFYSNSIKNGLLSVVLPASVIDILFARCIASKQYQLTVNLEQQSVSDDKEKYAFEISKFDKHCLLEGLDEIGLTLQHADAIRDYERRRRGQVPWLFVD